MIENTALVDKFKQALSDKWGYIWGTAGIEWTQAKQNQKVNYMVEKYGANWQKNADAKNDNYYMAALYGSKWIDHTVADCSGLFVWAFKQLGGSIYHGSNSIYDRYCKGKGKITDDIRKSMKPGTAVFVCKASGNKSHIGLYVGDGKVIEACSTQAGVCTSNITAGKWTYYGLLKDVSYSASEAPISPSEPADDKIPTENLPTLRKGNTGEYVTLLQTKLLQKGYDLGRYGVDGDFGKATEAAVKRFQIDHGLTADGIIGPKTWDALDQQTPAITLYSVTVPSLTKYQAEALLAQYPGSSMVEERR